MHNIDFPVTRDFSIHENIRFEILGEAFNLFDHTNVLSVSSTAFQYVAPGKTLPIGGTCPTVAAANDPNFNGCLSPYVSASSPFGAPTSTSGTL